LTTPNPSIGEIWLVRFPFSDLSSTKVRPALVLTTHRQDVIILGIFSKIPPAPFADTWVLIDTSHPNFAQTGLLKASVLRAEKIATAHQSTFQRKLGDLPPDLVQLAETALKTALKLS
jgi:mRNA interferase MazF